MIAPRGEFVLLDEVDSTQTVARQRILSGDPAGTILAKVQTQGRGRHDRIWLSGVGDSLTMSLTFDAYQNCSNLHLIGMATALAAAEVIGAKLQWPNDLVYGPRKVAGVLTEVVEGFPVVGIGINLAQTKFPEEIRHRATSLAMEGLEAPDPVELAKRILAHFDSVPEPTSWSELHRRWMIRDETPGKTYVAPDQSVLVARAIGSEGELIALSASGEEQRIYVADALFG